MAIDAAAIGSHGFDAVGATTITTGGGTSQASGSTFVIFAVFDAGVTNNTPTDSKGNTYTIIGSVIAAPPGSGRSKAVMYRCENGVGGASHTATMTFSGSAFGHVHLIEITGGTATPFDQTAQGTDSSTPFTVTSPTLTQAAEVVICGIATAGAAGVATHSSSNTTILDQDTGHADAVWSGAISKQVVAATTAFTPSWTCTNMTVSALILATFMEAAGAVGHPTMRRWGGVPGMVGGSKTGRGW